MSTRRSNIWEEYERVGQPNPKTNRYKVKCRHCEAVIGFSIQLFIWSISSLTVVVCRFLMVAAKKCDDTLSYATMYRKTFDLDGSWKQLFPTKSTSRAKLTTLRLNIRATSYKTMIVYGRKHPYRPKELLVS